MYKESFYQLNRLPFKLKQQVIKHEKGFYSAKKMLLNWVYKKKKRLIVYPCSCHHLLISSKLSRSLFYVSLSSLVNLDRNPPISIFLRFCQWPTLCMYSICTVYVYAFFAEKLSKTQCQTLCACWKGSWVSKQFLYWDLEVVHTYQLSDCSMNIRCASLAKMPMFLRKVILH